MFKFFFEITEPIEDNLRFTWDHHGIGENIYSSNSGQFNFVSSRGRGLLAGILPQIWPGSAGLLAGL